MTLAMMLPWAAPFVLLYRRGATPEARPPSVAEASHYAPGPSAARVSPNAGSGTRSRSADRHARPEVRMRVRERAFGAPPGQVFDRVS